jgi:site-specific DNA recombinase
VIIDAKRPGFLRLMNAIKPRPAFQVLIMSEESRLGREQIETAYALKQITGSGVRVWFYLEDRERTLDSAMDKVMLSLATFASEMERERAKVRTRDAMHRKASRGHVAGGIVYGYRNREIMAIGTNGQTIRDHVEREIILAEAATVRRIFEEIAQGRGFARIAKGLTADGIPSPRLRQGWAPSGVREMVFRDLYRGRIVWGRTKWVDRGGTKIKQDRPESEWLTVDAPQLHIVSEVLWQHAHERLNRTRQIYLRRNSGKLGGRPEAGLEMSGLLLCGTCGGAMHATKRTSLRGAPAFYYVCRTHRVRGELICANSLSAPMARLHEAVANAFKRDVLTPSIIEDTIARAIERHLAGAGQAAIERQGILGELGKLETELGRFTEAIATGEALPTLLDAIKARERRRADLKARLEHLEGLERAAGSWNRTTFTESLRGSLADWRGILEGNPVQARQILRKRLVGRLTLSPTVREDGRYYEIAGQVSYGRLLTVIIVVQGLVPPGGFSHPARSFGIFSGLFTPVDCSLHTL